MSDPTIGSLKVAFIFDYVELHGGFVSGARRAPAPSSWSYFQSTLRCGWGGGSSLRWAPATEPSASLNSHLGGFDSAISRTLRPSTLEVALTVSPPT